MATPGQKSIKKELVLIKFVVVFTSVDAELAEVIELVNNFVEFSNRFCSFVNRFVDNSAIWCVVSCDDVLVLAFITVVEIVVVLIFWVVVGAAINKFYYKIFN